jgi:hypothetical protein
MVASSAMTLF